MSRQKMARFAENVKRDNVIEPGKEIIENIKGNWHETYFKNNNDITIELACGRGEYTIGLARLFPDKNFIGVDLKGDRIWKGSGIALEEGLPNVAFLRVHILELLNYFEPGELSDIWITFPDPRPKDRDEKRRITHPRFLELYKALIKPGGNVFFKTDNTGLFEYTLEMLKERNDIEDLVYTFDLYHSELKPECYDIRTRYEQKFNELGHDIKYMRFKFKS
ncbi:tRNA (guanosine(46)-N7)-methyltransferase TrmB [Fulvivirga kasyanovii]|uniref:tRNA (guanine-N(7)-)-methyltransferase n=1 Tax=Fulvivirga kasyanovii TaxID=396812 RepID=A0ABW9RU75_9BACT|nr:tRNA (guanosine(46)-N7)-methyltransferase TrmB [Fulvivirga kasyanovii]MTI27743.1 tRNA (guanosine(46)-N7)-methyltransferase TrmB [Fulvivirga kasyanovii]